MRIRRAQVGDAPAICDLINQYAEQGVMLHRSLESIYGTLRDFRVAEDDGAVVGCVATHVFWGDLAEIKSLAVAPSHRGRGVGRQLVEAAAEDARRLGLPKLFALTYERDFFARMGFDEIDRGALPEKIWRECIACPKFDCCDETAMSLRLDAPRAGS